MASESKKSFSPMLIYCNGIIFHLGFKDSGFSPPLIHLGNIKNVEDKSGNFNMTSCMRILKPDLQTIFRQYTPPPPNPRFIKVLFFGSRARKNLQNSEFSEGRLFDKIEWGPPLKTEKLLQVMKKTEKARIEWGGSHSILATGARRNPELRGGSHSILSKRRPLRGSSHSIPFSSKSGEKQRKTAKNGEKTAKNAGKTAKN